MPVRPRSRFERRSPTELRSVPDPQAIRPLRQLSEQALSRTSGAPLVLGNHVRLLEDASGNYPVWLAAIAGARRRVYLENYMFEDDDVGRAFADALIERARAGVRVRVIRDWLGTKRGASASFWGRLEEEGVLVRCFNRFQLSSPFGWVSRDHRKMITVDGEVAFVAGLCISQRWQGDPRRNIPPWRDTGVEIRGPAVAAVEHAFAELWDTMGDPVPTEELSVASELPIAGEVALRVVAGVPSTAGLFRMDQLVAALARRTLWLTDAYFVGVTPYVQALRAAARDGVDVRLLLPNSTDLPVVRSLSRAGYRTLLEAGVRIFEWNGSMLHAKTAVVDTRHSRVGSSNLNLASFLGNYELDVAIDDPGFARQMEEAYERDLSSATEITLRPRRVLGVERKALRPAGDEPGERGLRPRQRRRGSRGAAVGALRVANTVGAAVANRRALERAEGGMLLVSGIALVLLAAVAVLWPRAVAMPIALFAVWIGLALIWRWARLSREP